MFLKPITKKGVTRLYLYESYYIDGKVTQRCYQSLGRLDELQKQYPDPIAYFKEQAAILTKEKNESRNLTVSIDLNETMDTNEDNLKNVGYGIIKHIYKELELDKFWKKILTKRSIRYDMEAVFQLLVISRILYPGSKKEAFDKKNIFFEKYDGFTLDDVYAALDLIDEHNESLQRWIYDHSVKLCDRDMSVSYFDCTNYYFDIGRPDVDMLNENGDAVDKDGNLIEKKYRKRGPEKNHRPDPIVGMGLLMDKNGIPLAFDLFPGNESEKVHMRPIINRVKTEMNDNCRIIFVADRGLNTSDNIYFLNGNNKGHVNERDGYVYGQSIRGADAEFKTWVLKEGYITDLIKDEDGNEIKFRHKSRIHPKTININVTVPGQKKPKKKSVVIDQKQMVYYSEKYAKKQKRDRDVMVNRAKDMINHPKRYDKVTSAGSAAYVKNISFDKTTGEIVDGQMLELNMEKILEEEKFDGYYSIVTSELKMSDAEIRKIYRGLSGIEETFKISKTDFESRPIYVRTNPHIEAHFSTCFTALVIIRLLQTKLGHKYSIGKTIESLRKYNCINVDKNTHQFIYFDEILKECEKVFHLKLDSKYATQLQVRRLLRY